MKKIASLLLLLAGMLALPAHAVVNVENYMGGDGVVKTSDAKELLSKVFLHNLSQLDKVNVEIAKLQKRTNVNIAFIYVGRLEDEFDTEIYVLTLDQDWNVLDGALLGYAGDPVLMEIADARNEMVYKTDDTQNYQLRGDTIKTQRTYTFGSTSLGGRYFRKEGKVYNNMLIRKDGMLVPLNVEATAILTEGDSNYLSEDHQLPKKSETKGEFDGYGMNLMRISQTPFTNKLNMEKLNGDAVSVKKAREFSNGDKRVLMKAALASRWIVNTGLRSSDEFLTWIAENPKEEAFTSLVLESIRESGMGELVWLQQRVNALKSKKARKWWQKWMKENGL